MKRPISQSARIQHAIAQAERRARERERGETAYKHPSEYKRGAGCWVRYHDPVPDEVIAEAIRVYSAPQDLTSRIAGDPPPGRSALDQRKLRVVT